VYAILPNEEYVHKSIIGQKAETNAKSYNVIAEKFFQILEDDMPNFVYKDVVEQFIDHLAYTMYKKTNVTHAVETHTEGNLSELRRKVKRDTYTYLITSIGDLIDHFTNERLSDVCAGIKRVQQDWVAIDFKRLEM